MRPKPSMGYKWISAAAAEPLSLCEGSLSKGSHSPSAVSTMIAAKLSQELIAEHVLSVRVQLSDAAAAWSQAAAQLDPFTASPTCSLGHGLPLTNGKQAPTI